MRLLPPARGGAPRQHARRPRATRQRCAAARPAPRRVWLAGSHFYLCAKVVFSPETVYTLGAKNGVSETTYKFAMVSTDPSVSASYSETMKAGCADVGESGEYLPVCDHPNYCKTDGNAVYLGQDHHVAYKPHRDNLDYFPAGFDALRDIFDGSCVYTAGANGNNALCNIPSNTHTWLAPAGSHFYLCAKVVFSPDKMFTLGAKNGVSETTYKFAMVQTDPSVSDSYSETMKAGCADVGEDGEEYLPVCDHPNYCKTDGSSVYLGQDHHIAYKPHRDNLGYFPAGFAALRDIFDDSCVYTAGGNGNNALCNIPSNTHTWLTPANTHFYLCARVVFSPDRIYTLGARNGVPETTYKFAMVQTDTSVSGSYSETMKAGCADVGDGYKPVCDHPNYCKSDGNAVYLGQDHHVAYKPHRDNLGYFPSGFEAVRDIFDESCVYTAGGNGNNALCNIPDNTHTWLLPASSPACHDGPGRVWAAAGAGPGTRGHASAA